MSQHVPLRPRRPRPAGERLSRARERSGRSPATKIEWGYEHSDVARRVQAVGEALADPGVYEPLPDSSGLARTREVTILPLGSTLVGENVLMRLEWDMAPGNFTRLDLLRAPLPDGRAVYVARGTLEVQVLAATEGEPDEDTDLGFLQALFRRNGEGLLFELFGGAPTAVEVLAEVDRLALVDLFWAALDEVPEAWEELVDASGDEFFEGWAADVPPLHACLAGDDSPATALRKVQILDDLLPRARAVRR